MAHFSRTAGRNGAPDEQQVPSLRASRSGRDNNKNKRGCSLSLPHLPKPGGAFGFTPARLRGTPALSRCHPFRKTGEVRATALILTLQSNATPLKPTPGLNGPPGLLGHPATGASILYSTLPM